MIDRPCHGIWSIRWSTCLDLSAAPIAARATRRSYRSGSQQFWGAGVVREASERKNAPWTRIEMVTKRLVTKESLLALLSGFLSCPGRHPCDFPPLQLECNLGW